MPTKRTIEFTLPLWEDQAPRKLPNAVLGIIIVIICEVMFFGGLISAHTIARASALGGIWPPPGQPRLPFERTAINTAALLLSGALLWFGSRDILRNRARALRYLAVSIVLGVAFVSLQGVEWVRLLRQGLTLSSSSEGSFFYLIVGAHALHAVAAIVALTWVYVQMRAGKRMPDVFSATRLFWYFVVILWPIIYLRVYL